MEPSSTIIFSSLPFLVTFLFVSTLVLQKIFPLLSGVTSTKTRGIQFSQTSSQTPSLSKSSIKRASALTFAATIALATVLIELVLCEISNTINSTTRELALRVTVTLLLILLIIAIPLLEIHTIISAAGWEYTGPGKGRLRIAWILQLVAFTSWLLGFWWSGQWLLTKQDEGQSVEISQNISELCLERVGIIGISLMSLLSGFASVSSPWQSFGARPMPVTEADIGRKDAGLEATNDMLSAKRSRLRALERKMLDAPTEGFFQKAIGSIRGNADHTERKTLELEISGLETMALSLSTSLSLLQTRLYHQRRSRTPIGCLSVWSSYMFSVYCIYRILTTTLTVLRRLLISSPQNINGSDPINNVLALVAHYYDPHLDQAAWARQISFLLSGVILFASFSSVMQTFHFFVRFTPNLLRAVQANLALIVAQVCATYVISATLMLRGMMPGDIVGEGLNGLGGKEMGWMDGWFEFWFLTGVGVTSAGIWISRKIAGGDEWNDDEDMEMGKRS